MVAIDEIAEDEDLVSTPQAVLDALQKLDPSDRETVISYISKLQSELQQSGGGNGSGEKDVEMKETEVVDDEMTPAPSDEQDMPPIYSSGEDYDKAAALKQEASDLKDSGDLQKALEKYTEAVLAAPPSSLLYANRATVLLKLGHPKAAERDCDLALSENPDSAKALRVRGKARKEMGLWELALQDLSASQTIDFDEGTVEDLKFLAEKHLELEKQEAEERNKDKERMQKRADEIRKAQEKAKREQSARSVPFSSSAAMPGGGMPGAGMPGAGMPDMSGLMASLMSDPELVTAMQNPKVQAALQDLMSLPGGPMALMSNPAKLQEIISDPEVGPVIQKLISKLGPAMGGGAGVGAMPGVGHGADEDIPDMGTVPDLD